MSGILHAHHKKPNGAAADGELVITVNTEKQVIRDPVGNVVFQGPLVLKLVAGEATITLPASDDATLSPTGFTFTATEQLKHVAKANYRVVDFQVATGQTLHTADLAGTDEAAADPSYGASLNGAMGSIEALRDGDDATFEARLTAAFAATDGRQLVFGDPGDLNAQGVMSEWVLNTYSGDAPFVICIGGNNPFEGQQDDLFLWGYNRAGGGSRKVLTQPSLGFQIEAHVRDSSDSRFPTVTDNFEWNLDYAYTDGSTGLRFMAFRCDREEPEDYTHWLWHISGVGTGGYWGVERFDGSNLLRVFGDTGDTDIGGKVTAEGGFKSLVAGTGLELGSDSDVSVDASGDPGGRFAVDSSEIRLGLPVRFGGGGLNDVSLQRSGAGTAQLSVGSQTLTIGDSGASQTDLNAGAALRLYAATGGITLRSATTFDSTVTATGAITASAGVVSAFAGKGLDFGSTTTISLDAAGDPGGRFSVNANDIRLGKIVKFGGGSVSDVTLARSSASTMQLVVGSQTLFIGDSGTSQVDLNAGAGMRLFAGSGGITVRSNVGFYGTTPIAKRGATADATDLASVVTLANALKADLIAYGLKAS